MDLTTDKPTNELTETEVMGRTVYVGEQSKEAYVPFQDELVSMTNLLAWNILMEKAKQDVLDGYEREKSVQEKKLERKRDRAASKIREMADKLYRESDHIRGGK